MPPTTQNRTPQEGIDVIRQHDPQLANQVSQTLSRPSNFTVDVPETIPSTALKGNTTIQDVVTRRNRAEQEQMFDQQVGADFDAVVSRMNDTSTATPFRNPEQFLSRLLLNQPTETQNQLDEARGEQADRLGSFAEDFRDTRDQAREEFDVAGLTDQLAETRTRIAERQKQLREDLRNVSNDPEKRGMARQFVDQERNRINSDALTELADLSIIEAAQTGNLQLANEQIDNILTEMETFFDFEKDAIEAEISRLENIDTRESENRANQLQVALSNFETQARQRIDNEREKRGYMVDAAANGADQGTLDAIRNAATPGEAVLHAAPWIGRLDRLASNASPSDSSAEVPEQYKSLVEQAASLAGAADQRENTKTIMANALANEDYVTAYAQIANNVEEGLTGTVKTRFANARTDIGVMDGMKTAIEEYVAAGGDTGILKGKAEDIASKFGVLANSDDPEFAALGAQLQREFQTYRNIMTGAAFSPQESQEYAKVNPTTDKSLDLNLAIMEGATNQLENRIVSTIESRVTGAKDIYDRAVTGGADVEEASWDEVESLPVGDNFKIEGTVYQKVGDDEYIEL